MNALNQIPPQWHRLQCLAIAQWHCAARSRRNYATLARGRGAFGVCVGEHVAAYQLCGDKLEQSAFRNGCVWVHFLLRVHQTKHPTGARLNSQEAAAQDDSRLPARTYAGCVYSLRVRTSTLKITQTGRKRHVDTCRPPLIRAAAPLCISHIFIYEVDGWKLLRRASPPCSIMFHCKTGADASDFFLPACTCSVASCVHQTLFTAVVTSKRQTYLV